MRMQTLCVRRHKGPQFIISSEEPLYGMESAQNFSLGKLAHSQHAKPGTEQPPSHMVAML